ncbi:odhB, partial [Symbiodinium sp. KB8]
MRGSVAFQGARRWLSAASGNVTMDVPSMGDSISEGTLVEWMKAPGDWVDEDEVIAMIETDKVTIDVHASCSGVVVEHKAEEQDNVEVGAALVVIDTSAEKPA